LFVGLQKMPTPFDLKFRLHLAHTKYGLIPFRSADIELGHGYHLLFLQLKIWSGDPTAYIVDITKFHLLMLLLVCSN
jgi:hypothetical protein